MISKWKCDGCGAEVSTAYHNYSKGTNAMLTNENLDHGRYRSRYARVEVCISMCDREGEKISGQVDLCLACVRKYIEEVKPPMPTPNATS